MSRQSSLKQRRKAPARSLMFGLLATLAASAGAQEDPVKVLVDQGKYWQARGRADRAAESWQKILRLDPNQPEALYGMGVAELEAGRADSARSYLDRLNRVQPNSALSRQLAQSIQRGSAGTRQQVEQARELARSGQADEAVKRYEQAAGGAVPQGDLALEYYQTLGGTAQGWDQARRGLEQIARNNPSDARAQLALAQHLTYRDNTRRDGIRQLEALAARPDVGAQAAEAWRRALNWLGGRPADAPFYQAWLATHPDDAPIRAKLDAITRQTETERAAAAADPLRAAAADPLRAVVQQGFAALNAGDQVRAAERFQSVLTQRPNDADALAGMGVLRLKQEKFAEASDFLERAARNGAGTRYRQAQNSAQYWLLVQQATAAREAGNRSQARQLLERAVRLDAGDGGAQTSAQVALADLLAEDRQYAQAEAAYRRVLQRQPDNPDATRGLVSVLAAQNKSTEALALVERMTPAQRDKVGSVGRLRADQARAEARQALQAGDAARARRLLEDAMAADPMNPWVRLDVARNYVAMGMPEQARNVMDNLLASAPTNVEALFASALLASETNAWQRGLDLLEQIPAAQRTAEMGTLQRRLWVHAEAERASGLAAAGQQPAALGVLQQAERFAQGDPELTGALAQGYADAGDDQRALTLMRGAMSRSVLPDVGTQLQYAAILLKTRQDMELAGLLRQLAGAQMTARQRRDYDDLRVAYIVRQADALTEAGDLVAAYDMLAPALSERGGSSAVRASLARMYAQAGENKQALDIYQSVLAREPNNLDMRLAAIGTATAAKEYRWAEQALQPALQQSPNSPAVLTAAGRLYRAQGRNAKAEQYFRQAVAAEAATGNALADGTRAPGAGFDRVPANPFVGMPGQRRASQLPPPGSAAPYAAVPQTAAPQGAGYAGAPGPASQGMGYAGVPASAAQGGSGYAGGNAALPQGTYAGVPSAAQPAGMMPVAAAMPGQPYIPMPVSAGQRGAPMQAAAMQAPSAYYPAAARGTLPPGTTAAGKTTTAARGKATPTQQAYPQPYAQPYAQNYAQPVQQGGYAQQAYAPPGAQSAYPQPGYAQQPYAPSGAQATASPQAYAAAQQPTAPQPYGAQSRLPWLADADDDQPKRTGPKTALDELREIEQQRTTTLAGGPMLRGRNGDSGMSQLTELQVVAEGKKSVGDGKLIGRVTPVAIDAGNLGGDYNSASRFGGGPLAYTLPSTGQNVFSQTLPSTSAGSQSAFGVALGVAYESDRFNVDVGSTPLGFRYTDITAGARVNFPLTQRSTLALSGSRRSVTDSLLSYAGARDQRTGDTWGGVMQSGGRADLGWDDGFFGIYGYGGYSVLTGHDVERNNKWEGGGGFYMRLIDDEAQRLTSGINFTSMGYSENLRYFTVGHGGYFSPQTYFAVTVPLALSGRSGRVAYHVRGALGVQAFREDDADYFPTDAARQADANRAVQQANQQNLTNQTSAVYAGQSKTGLAYNLVGSVEYQAAQQLFVGGTLGIDNARDYRQWYAGVYVRYALQKQNGAIAFPPVPPQSAVGALPF
ncbi:cellulose biosynthesis protein BcsC [Cupriavidus plantarum]|uniref:cellulose biosynthesis protein BcsC n=1 Tax=Cupriavidus plantarum TaxID=942865 RepID=UPI001B27B6D4|nr:cellulose biosynthesis protein BcsC [Cupriavidus plantarum]CAG2151228.1 Lipopolysaccharide assembly protein B [Cupriavidus plantarum]SMR65901.1 Tetratricopeptide repeat-containing protein [Cupriavidus plantarum]